MSRAQDRLGDLHRSVAGKLNGFKQQLEDQVCCRLHACSIVRERLRITNGTASISSDGAERSSPKQLILLLLLLLLDLLKVWISMTTFRWICLLCVPQRRRVPWSLLVKHAVLLGGKEGLGGPMSRGVVLPVLTLTPLLWSATCMTLTHSFKIFLWNPGKRRFVRLPMNYPKLEGSHVMVHGSLTLSPPHLRLWHVFTLRRRQCEGCEMGGRRSARCRSAREIGSPPVLCTR